MRGLERALTVLTMMVAFATATCAQTAAPTSPETVARAYARSLATDDLRDFWAHAVDYTFETEAAKAAAPRSMWDTKISAIQEAWRTRMANQRSSGQIYPGQTNCWNVFRPGAGVAMLETRRESDKLWHSFVKVTYAPAEKAPLHDTGRGWRRVREATVLMQLTTAPALRRTLVSDTCTVVNDTITFWQAPDLARERALELAKDATASFRPHAGVELPVGVPAPAQEVLFTDRPIRAVEQLKSALERHGVRVTPEGRQGLNLDVPASWSRFQLADGTYLLSESEGAELTEFVVFREDARVGLLRLSYPGCSPICALLKYLDGQSSAHLVFRNAPSGEWPTEITRQVSFAWDDKAGWKVSAVQ